MLLIEDNIYKKRHYFVVMIVRILESNERPQRLDQQNGSIHSIPPCKKLDHHSEQREQMKTFF